tara:strand:- start:29 stop:610 length:582 start_codon:yes stop_codon:yes gene_type:complete
MKLKTEIEYLGFKENLIFLSSSILLIWTWAIISMNLDKGNDRGLLTICGFIIVTSIVLSFFLSKKTLTNTFRLIFQFAVVCILTFIFTLTVGLKMADLIGADWIGFIIPVLMVGISCYLILRQLTAFPNNNLAFWTFIAIPILTIIGTSIIRNYDNTIAYDFGTGLPTSIFLTLLFISIGVLCREKTTAHNNV